MAFVRFCHRHRWIDAIPPVEKLDTDDVMKGRPITGEEFGRMLAATPEVVGEASASSCFKLTMQLIGEPNLPPRMTCVAGVLSV